MTCSMGARGVFCVFHVQKCRAGLWVSKCGAARRGGDMGGGFGWGSGGAIALAGAGVVAVVVVWVVCVQVSRRAAVGIECSRPRVVVRAAAPAAA